MQRYIYLRTQLSYRFDMQYETAVKLDHKITKAHATVGLLSLTTRNMHVTKLPF